MTPYTIKLEKFEGPFGLLLELIENKELNITEVALAEVTEQYLHYLDDIEQQYPEELADFLVVATKLLLLKSRALLPVPEEEEDPQELMQQLKMFQVFSQAAIKIDKILQSTPGLLVRQPGKKAPQSAMFHPPQGITAKSLHDFFVDVLKKLEPIVKIPKAAITKAVSLKEKIAAIRNLLMSKKQLSFRDLVSAEAASRTDVIVTFLAMLELVKQREVTVRQPQSFQDIVVTKL